MKILFVTQNLAPFRINWLQELSKEFDITVFHLNEYDVTCNPKYIDRISTNIKTEDISRFFMGKKIFRISKIAKNKYDALILDGYGFLGQVILISYLSLRHKQFALSLDGAIYSKQESKMKYIVKKFCLNSANAFFSTSNQTDEYIRHYVCENKTIYRHRFSSVFSKNIVTPRERKELHDKYKKELNFDEKKVVLCVGRFVDFKRFDIVFNAANELNDDYMIIFAGGKAPKKYMDLINDQNRQRIKVVDFLYPEELRKYYIAADVFCHPAQGEIWGLVIGEAMAMGLPIVSSDTCNAALEMVTPNGGILIHGDNPSDYAVAIIEILNNLEYARKLGDYNVQVIKQYAIDVAAKEDIDNIYRYINANKASCI